MALIEGELLGHVPDLIGIHHVHVWTMTGEKPTITLHATLSAGAPQADVIVAIRARLAEKMGCEHTTVQLEEEGTCNTPDFSAKPH